MSLIPVALLALAHPALAQIDLTWDNCVIADLSAGEPAPSINQDFDCKMPHGYKLHGSFKTPVDFSRFVGMDIIIDLFATDQFGNPNNNPLSPFWHYELSYEAAGCNSDGLLLNVRKDQSGNGGNACGLFQTPWGLQGQAVVFSGITNYAPDSPQNGRARLSAQIYRQSANPYSLSAGVNYYAFHIEWTTERSGACSGCTESMEVFWTSALLHDDMGQTVTLSGASPKATYYFASINGPIFLPDPVANTTWGQIKSQYR